MAAPAEASSRGIVPRAWSLSESIPAFAKALAFIDPERLSATVVLTALNRFLRETHGSKNAFLDGNFTERLCQPLVDYIEARGGQVLINKPLDRILVDLNDTEEPRRVTGFRIRGIGGRASEIWCADKYVSAMPVHVTKQRLPSEWAGLPFFRDAYGSLRSVPVISVQLWFDRKLPTLDSLIFSRSRSCTQLPLHCCSRAAARGG